MIRLCSGLNSLIIILSVFAIAVTFRFTTQEHMKKLATQTVFEYSGESTEESDDEAPQPLLVEEEIVIGAHFKIQPATVRLLKFNFAKYINMLPQLYQSDFLRPPSL